MLFYLISGNGAWIYIPENALTICIEDNVCCDILMRMFSVHCNTEIDCIVVHICFFSFCIQRKSSVVWITHLYVQFDTRFLTVLVLLTTSSLKLQADLITEYEHTLYEFCQCYFTIPIPSFLIIIWSILSHPFNFDPRIKLLNTCSIGNTTRLHGVSWLKYKVFSKKIWQPSTDKYSTGLTDHKMSPTSRCHLRYWYLLPEKLPFSHEFLVSLGCPSGLDLRTFSVSQCIFYNIPLSP